MKKHLKYIDDSSDKFWQIKVLDSSYTVTYGKNGTSGVSQTKTFTDSSECLKMAEKLLNEKIRKGYSESGEVIKNESTGRSKNTNAKDTDKILKGYDAIISSRDLSQLLPFIKDNSKGNLEVLKKHIKQKKKYLMSFVEFNEGPDGPRWGVRGDEKQNQILTLSAIALFNKAEVLTWDEIFDVLEKVMIPPILEIVKWASPTWILEYLSTQIRKNDWRRFDYTTLRFMEDESLIVHHPELFAICLANFNEYQNKLKSRDYINYVVNDPLAYERDVPELFNYPTNLHNGHFRDNNQEAYNKYNTWEIIYMMLLEEGKISRVHFIEQVILIQTKEWNSNLRSFFRKRLTDLNPSAEELIVGQENIFSYFHSSVPAITNFAIEMVKKIYEHKKFATASFLDWLEPIMMSTDNKAAIKNALPLLEKINKLYPKLNHKIVYILADVYVIPDMNLQERATKILLKIASDEDISFKEKLSGYIPLMQGNTFASLSAFLNEQSISNALSEVEIYHFNPQKEKVLTTPIELPKDWNDILYLFGKFIASDDVADSEVLINAFIMQTELFPSDYSAQLQPYEQQLEKKYFNNVYKAYVTVFLRLKIEDFNSTYRVSTDDRYHKIKTLLLGHKMLELVNIRMHSNLKSPLLSFPTHQPHWVEPKVLIERLIAYQQHDETINHLDLGIAISRMPRENLEEAIPLLDQLNGEIKELMKFCLGVTKQIRIKSPSLLNKLFTKIAMKTSNQFLYLWALAARTYYPDEIFHEFGDTDLKDLDFVISPFKPKGRIEERKNEYMNHNTREMEKSPSWYELNFNLSPHSPAPHHFLLTQDHYGSKKGWEYILSEGDLYYWNSLMPQQNDPLGYFLLRGHCANSSNGSMVLKGFLNVINAPGFRFSGITMLVFACSFFQEKKEVRLMAAEVFINLIEKKVVDIQILAEKIAYLASNKYGVFSRLTDSLATLKDISGLHNSASLQLIDGILIHLDIDDKLPVNFKKMVEHYVDLLYKTKQTPPPESVAFFEKHKNNAPIKSLITQILK